MKAKSMACSDLPWHMRTLITNPFEFSAVELAEFVASVAPGALLQVHTDFKNGYQRVYGNSSEGPVLIFTRTPVLNAFEVCTNSSVEQISSVLGSTVDGLSGSGISIVDAGKYGRIHPYMLAVAEEVVETGSRLCEIAGNKCIMIASANFIRNEVKDRCEIICKDKSAFAARIDGWSNDLDDYIKGAVSGSPPVIVGSFSDENAIEFCAAISEVSMLPGTTFDLGATELVLPMAQYSNWSVALNQGDTGCEDMIFAVFGRENEVSCKIERAIKIWTTIGVDS